MRLRQCVGRCAGTFYGNLRISIITCSSIHCTIEARNTLHLSIVVADYATLILNSQVVNLQVQVTAVINRQVIGTLCRQVAAALQLISLDVDVAAGNNDILDIDCRLRNFIHNTLVGFATLYSGLDKAILLHLGEDALSFTVQNIIFARIRSILS